MPPTAALRSADAGSDRLVEHVVGARGVEARSLRPREAGLAGVDLRRQGGP